MTAMMIKPTTNAISTISIGSRMVIMRRLACCASYSIESAMESSMESSCPVSSPTAMLLHSLRWKPSTLSSAADRLTPERTCASTASNCETM